MKTRQEPISSTITCQEEIITNVNNNFDQHEKINKSSDSLFMTTDSCTTNSLSPSSLISTFSPLMRNSNEDQTIKILSKEAEEEKKKEYCDDDNVRAEEENNCNVEHNYHASGTILINNEPTQAVLLEQEEKEKEGEEQEQEQVKERPSPPLLTLEQCNQQRIEDESPVQILSNNIKKFIMSNIDENEKQYKKIEIEEIPDEEEALLEQNNHSIEPTDYILTDDEPKMPRPSSSKSNIPSTYKGSVPDDMVLSCYEKALSKTMEKIDDLVSPSNVSFEESQVPSTVKCNQRPEDDPIALRALQRFEQCMNAAIAAKTGNEDTNSLFVKGKSSWSGTVSNPRKSLEHVFQCNQQVQSTHVSNNEQSTTISPSQRDSFIRPRKAILDDSGTDLGMKPNLFEPTQDNSTDDDNYQSKEQQQPTIVLENGAKQG